MTSGGALLLALLLVPVGTIPLDGQTPAVSPPAADSTSHDRNWRIDISNREIVERAFDEGVSLVAADEEGRWYICAGAAVSADEVRINLTNVQGEVRLNADLERLRKLFGGGNIVTVTGSDASEAGAQDAGCESSTGPKPGNQSPDGQP